MNSAADWYAEQEYRERCGKPYEGDAKKMPEQIKLRKCPFCGGEASYTDNFYGNGTGHCVFCEDCGAGTAIMTGATPPKELKEMVYKEWNKRDDSAVNRWIPCSERLPEQDGEYLVYTEYEDIFKCAFESEEECKWGFMQDYRDPDTLGWAGTVWTAVETVTHWMPLPEPPEKE